jgi:hypothetical protein
MVTRNIDWRVRVVGTGIFLTNSIRVFEVNSTAAKVFLMCDGKHDIDMMVSEIKNTFETINHVDEIRIDIDAALEILKNIGAIQN